MMESNDNPYKGSNLDSEERNLADQEYQKTAQETMSPLDEKLIGRAAEKAEKAKGEYEVRLTQFWGTLSNPMQESLTGLNMNTIDKMTPKIKELLQADNIRFTGDGATLMDILELFDEYQQHLSEH